MAEPDIAPAFDPAGQSVGDALFLTPDNRSKARFVAAAAREFIETGYERCTIRAIAARAGTSVASLSRNWSGKRHLFETVFGYHFYAINMAQHRNFDMLDAFGASQLEDILYAFYRPVLGREHSDDGLPASHQVYCKALSDPSEEVKQIVRPMVADVRQRLVALTRESLPNLSEQDLFLAMNVINGTYVYPQIHGPRMATVMGLDFDSMNWNDAALKLSRIVAAGLTAFHAPPANAKS